jgi:glycosyltransferase involved in cell wall biosynthesis
MSATHQPRGALSQARLLIINFTGDVREAYNRLSAGGAETYHAQRYHIEGYAKLGMYAEHPCVLACVTSEQYDELLPNGVRAIGGGLADLNDPEPVFRLIEKIAPTHVVLSTPLRSIIRWLLTKEYRSIGCFAGSISNLQKGWLRQVVTRLRNADVGRCLNSPKFEWVASYGLASCRLLADAGVNENKIIPWDLLLDEHPGEFQAKKLPVGGGEFSVCYVGGIQEAKGVGDLIDAVARLQRPDFSVRATIVGDDSGGFARQRVAQHGLQSKVNLPGLLPNSEIEPLMHRSDVVVVPSRPDYPEGFPLVIHHALRARTPVVASNHPLFRVHLQHRVTAELFEAGNAKALADSLAHLLKDADLYARLSESSHDTWRQMRLPVKWHDIVERWMADTAEAKGWLGEHTMAVRQEGSA